MIIGPSERLNVAAELGFCVDELNRYRALAGLPAFQNSAGLETYAAEGAKVDATAKQAHTHFRGNNGGGIAKAETELLLWSGGNVHAVIERGVEMMWNERGEHYDILAAPHAEAGCGIFVNEDGITVTQDFR
jgi:hypothetical protein